MERVRSFDKYVRGDMRDNPGEWTETMSPEDWINMFNDYISGDTDD